MELPNKEHMSGFIDETEKVAITGALLRGGAKFVGKGTVGAGKALTYGVRKPKTVGGKLLGGYYTLEGVGVARRAGKAALSPSKIKDPKVMRKLKYQPKNLGA